MTRKANPLEASARALAIAAGIDPDSRIPKPGSERGMPAWCDFTSAARAEQNVAEAAAAATDIVNLRPQEPQYQNSPVLCSNCRQNIRSGYRQKSRHKEVKL